MGVTNHRAHALASLVAAVCGVAALAGPCRSSPARAYHLSNGCAGARSIALTFDDGPNPPYTQRILEMLSAAGARATFFDEGQAVEAHPELAREEAARGMAVGSHSYTHGQDLPTMPPQAFADDLRRAEGALASALGFRPAIYRAPYGHTSDTMLLELGRARYTSIGWDIDSEDWSDATADRVVDNVLRNAHPGGIVLMHDGGLGGGNPDRSATLAALPRILDGLRAQGYDLVTVPELTGVPAVQGGRRPQGEKCSAS